jgi:uncharacterized protein YukE
MITRLFRSKPKLDSKAPEHRRSAIEALSEQDAVKADTELSRLAQEDDDLGVRRAAIARLHSESALQALLADTHQADRVVERIIELNSQGQCMALAEAPMVLAARLSNADDPGTVAAHLLELGGHHLLIKALLGAPRAHRESLLNLPQLRQVEVLQALERGSRDRDKKTNQFARARLEEIRKQITAASTLSAELEERLSSLEKSHDDNSDLERERRAVLLGRIEQSLETLETLTRELAATGTDLPDAATLAQRYKALAQQQQTLDQPPAEHTPADQAPTVDSARRATEATAGQGVDFDELTDRFQALDNALATHTDFEALAAERQTLTDLWLAGADHAPPSDGQHRVFEQVSHRFQQLAEARRRLQSATITPLDPAMVPAELGADTDSSAWRAAAELEGAVRNQRKTLDHIGWPDWATVPEEIATQRTLVESATARLESWRQTEQQRLAELTEALTKLDTLIDSGELKSARAEAGRIRRSLKPVPDRSALELNRHLARASARLAELSDWQTYATTPKREALLAAMTEIADNPLAPPDQASRIKSLRNEWNELGPVGRSDGQKLLDAFNDVAERAFEPCRTHFAEQADVRAANLAAREAICESLAGYLAATDWAATDYKAAERIMRTARDEWRTYHPVDRTAGKAMEDRFEALQADLHEHIKAEWDRNLAAKQLIVEEAKALLESEQGIADQVEGAKRLQHRWKTIGTTPRRPDQNLWREFRIACDAIFENRDTAKQSEDAEIQANREAAEQLLANFRRQLDETSDPLDGPGLRAFQNQFAELPRLPDRLARGLERERDDLIRAAQQVLRDRRAAETITRLENLKAQDAEVSALEQRQRTGETVEFTPPDPIFAARCQPDATPASAEELTRIAIEAEIAADLESVETDLRMSLQVELMNAGRGREALEATPEDLTRRWCELGPKDSTADPLRDRLFIAIAALLRR